MKPIDRFIDWLLLRGYLKEAEDAARYMTNEGVRSNGYENIRILLLAWEYSADVGYSTEHAAAHFLELHWWHRRQCQRYEELWKTMRSAADDVQQVRDLSKQVEQLEIRAAALSDELSAEKAASSGVDSRLKQQRKEFEKQIDELKKRMPRSSVVEYAANHEPFRNDLHGRLRHVLQKELDSILHEYAGGQIVERTSSGAEKIEPLAT